MSTPISSVLDSPAVNTVQPPVATGNSPADQQQMFLKLLVAQLQNQDPLNPADGMTFVTQLAQFSQVETLLGIRSDLKDVLAKTATTTPEPDITAPAV